MIFLRQSTASQEVVLGHFVDSTDGNTEETGLTIANTDIKIWKSGATTLANKNSGGATHISNGVYYAVLDATDTDTCGGLVILVHVAGALAFRLDCHVLEEAVYDAFYAASALGYIANAPVNVAQFGGSNGTFASGRPEVNATHWAGTAVGSTTVRADLINIAGAAVSTTTAQLGVNVVQVSGDSAAADNVETAFDGTAGSVPWLGIVDQGTAQAGAATSIQLRAGASFADDQLNGMTVVIVSGTGAGQARLITDWVSATDTATVATWQTNPDATSVYRVYGTAPASSSGGATAQEVWEYATRTLTAGTNVNGSTFTSIPWNAAWDAEVQSEVADALAVYDPPTNAEMEARTIAAADYATATNLATVDTVVDAIKAKTDSLTFTTAGIVDANVQQINDVTITGDGQVGTEFGV